MATNEAATIGGTQVEIPPDEPVDSPEEGVLRDVLEELDRERSRRAELEEQVRKLTEDVQKAEETARASQKQQPIISESRHAMVAMKTQVEGFRQLVDTLTAGKPAIALASEQKARQKTLPLHVVRLLEVLPWDPRAQEHIFGQEEVYEWQTYDIRELKWQSQLRYFPVLFKSMPIIKPKAEGGRRNEDEQNPANHLLVFLAGGDKGASAPSKHGVLTNEGLTMIYNLEAGYPLPNDGGQWEWIGGWRVDKTNNSGSDSSNLPEDDQGWSYGMEAQHFLLRPSTLISDSRGAAEDKKRNIRRRKWIRRRVLTDYPLASERTQQYLKLVAENARLSVVASKISDQLVETRTALTEAETQVMQAKEKLEQKDRALASAGVEIKSIIEDGSAADAGNRLQEFLGKNEHVKEFGSKITQWVSGTPSKDMSGLESTAGDDSVNGNLDGSQKFDWKKIGRGGLLERIKQKNVAATPERDRVNSASANDGTGELGLDVEEDSQSVPARH